MRRAVASIERTTGTRPYGWYCRYAPSLNTRRLVVEEGGFLYDSDAYDDDLPHWTRVGGKPHLVIPYTLDNNDMKFSVAPGFTSGEGFFRYLKDAFDVLYREGKTSPKMMSVGLHTRLAGRPGRAAALERFLDYLVAHDDVWICRRIDIARHWIADAPGAAHDASERVPAAQSRAARARRRDVRAGADLRARRAQPRRAAVSRRSTRCAARTSSPTCSRSSTCTTRRWPCCAPKRISPSSRTRTSRARARRASCTPSCSSTRRRTPRAASPFETVIDGLWSAVRDSERRYGVTSKLIMCFLRDHSAESAMATLEQALPYGERIVAVGLDSAEVGHPPSKFARVFERALAEGWKTVAHAGEEGPPAYVWEALDLLRVSRVDHGVRSLEDPALVARLRDERIPLTVCPLSNVKLRVFDTLRDHNLGAMLDAGLVATVNSDDPAYFGGYAGDNFAAVAQALELPPSALVTLARNSFEASFIDAAHAQRRTSRASTRPRWERRRRARADA